MKLLISVCCTIISICFFPSSACAVTISSFSQVTTQEIDAKALVVTDINDTLITCEDLFWQKATLKGLKGETEAKLNNLTDAQKNVLANLIMQKCTNREMAGAASFFKLLNERRIKTLALSAAYAEPLDGVDMSERVKSELARVGLSFKGFLDSARVFTSLTKDTMSGGYPTLLEGSILLTNGSTSSKGDVLKAYIEAIPKEERPTQVWFFDDTPAHLESVMKVISAMGIIVKTFQVSGSLEGVKILTLRQVKVWESLIDRATMCSSSDSTIKH